MTSRQTRKTDGPALRLIAAGALIVASACAAPILATDTTGIDADPDTRGTAPVRCGIATNSQFGITTFRPWVQLDRVQPGSYSFALSGGGTVIDQGGSFEVGATGQSLLGEASVSGPASLYEAELKVTVDGVLYSCHATPDEI